MSRKSRQKGARKLLRHVLPVWLAIVMLIASLLMGVFCTAMSWIQQPTPLEDTIPRSDAVQRVEGKYDKRRNKGFRLTDIYVYFAGEDPLYIPDDERLIISSILANEALLEQLQTSPAGTMFDMRLKPNGIDILTLSVNGEELISYEGACRAIRANNTFGIVWGVFCLVMAVYAAWSLLTNWRYRRLLTN